MTHNVSIDPDALLARARALRQTPKGLKVTERLLISFKGKLTGMPKENLREKEKDG